MTKPARSKIKPTQKKARAPAKRAPNAAEVAALATKLPQVAIKPAVTSIPVSQLVPAELPQPPIAVDYSKVTTAGFPGWISSWTTNACAFAAVGNLMLGWSVNGGTQPGATWQDLWNIYLDWTRGNIQGEIAMSSVLAQWQNYGFGAKTDKILAAARLEANNATQLQDSIFIFGGCLIGLSLPKSL